MTIPRSLARGASASRARRATRATRSSDRRPAVDPSASGARGAAGPSRPVHAERRARCPRLRRRRQAPATHGRDSRRRPTARCDAFFVDLQKAERDYSPTTMYRDYAINRELFHWESQSTPDSAAADRVRRWIEHQQRGGTHPAVRPRQERRSSWDAAVHVPRPRDYVDHRGERPVAFTWRLPVPMPEELFEVARSVAAA